MHQGLCRERREGLQGHLGHQEMHRGPLQNLQRAKCLGMRQKLGRCCCLGCCLGTRQILGWCLGEYQILGWSLGMG